MDNQKDEPAHDQDEPIVDNPYESPRSSAGGSSVAVQRLRLFGIVFVVGLSSVIAFCCSCFPAAFVSVGVLEGIVGGGEGAFGIRMVAVTVVACGTGLVVAVLVGRAVNRRLRGNCSTDDGD